MENFLLGCVIGLIFGCFMLIAFNEPFIESDVKINPTLKLTIKDNKVDTLYVYKQLK